MVLIKIMGDDITAARRAATKCKSHRRPRRESKPRCEIFIGLVEIKTRRDRIKTRTVHGLLVCFNIKNIRSYLSRTHTYTREADSRSNPPYLIRPRSKISNDNADQAATSKEENSLPVPLYS